MIAARKRRRSGPYASLAWLVLVIGGALFGASQVSSMLFERPMPQPAAAPIATAATAPFGGAPLSEIGAPPNGAAAPVEIGAAGGSGIGRSNSMLESWLAPNSAPPITSASQARPA